MLSILAYSEQKSNENNLGSLLKKQPAEEKIEREKPQKKDTTLELKVDEEIEIPETDDLGITSIKYLPLEDDLPESIYNPHAFNTNLYGIFPYPEEEEEASVQAQANNYDSDMTADEEARERLQESKYDPLIIPTEIDYEEKKKLALWIAFHTAEFSFLESFYGLNRNVDYRSIV